ncbi:C-type lectin protein [Ranid herpesvirus 3]|uniref:C-type lectin protein n=1 Tax=Ranid herpesvirus 3 TaxID=1987509 RepID=A0A1X9T5I4_9VIRU|nr:C-type lectin protein [Ranid herpesvirus 3]ARR28964.1 C-type lectin protein [Ranid herpesvirus 3]
MLSRIEDEFHKTLSRVYSGSYFRIFLVMVAIYLLLTSGVIMVLLLLQVFKRTQLARIAPIPTLPQIGISSALPRVAYSYYEQCPEDFSLHHDMCYYITDKKVSYAENLAFCYFEKQITSIILKHPSDLVYFRNRNLSVWLSLIKYSDGWEWEDGTKPIIVFREVYFWQNAENMSVFDIPILNYRNGNVIGFDPQTGLKGMDGTEKMLQSCNTPACDKGWKRIHDRCLLALQNRENCDQMHGRIVNDKDLLKKIQLSPNSYWIGDCRPTFNTNLTLLHRSSMNIRKNVNDRAEQILKSPVCLYSGNIDSRIRRGGWPESKAVCHLELIGLKTYKNAETTCKKLKGFVVMSGHQNEWVGLCNVDGVWKWSNKELYNISFNEPPFNTSAGGCVVWNGAYEVKDLSHKARVTCARTF